MRPPREFLLGQMKSPMSLKPEGNAVGAAMEKHGREGVMKRMSCVGKIKAILIASKKGQFLICLLLMVFVLIASRPSPLCAYVSKVVTSYSTGSSGNYTGDDLVSADINNAGQIVYLHATGAAGGGPGGSHYDLNMYDPVNGSSSKIFSWDFPAIHGTEIPILDEYGHVLYVTPPSWYGTAGWIGDARLNDRGELAWVEHDITGESVAFNTKYTFPVLDENGNIVYDENGDVIYRDYEVPFYNPIVTDKIYSFDGSEITLRYSFCGGDQHSHARIGDINNNNKISIFSDLDLIADSDINDVGQIVTTPGGEVEINNRREIFEMSLTDSNFPYSYYDFYKENPGGDTSKIYSTSVFSDLGSGEFHVNDLGQFIYMTWVRSDPNDNLSATISTLYLVSPTVYGLFVGLNSSGGFYTASGQYITRDDLGGKDAETLDSIYENYYKELGVPYHSFVLSEVLDWNRWDKAKTGMTKDYIQSFFQAIASQIQPYDQFLLYFSGHGTYDDLVSANSEPSNFYKLKGWQLDSGTNDIYYVELENRPRYLVIDGQLGNPVKHEVDLGNKNDYFWDQVTKTLYLKSSSFSEVTVDEKVWFAQEGICLGTSVTPEGSANNEYLYDDELANWLSGLNPTIKKEIILDACFSGGFWLDRNDAKGDLKMVPNTALLASAVENKISTYDTVTKETHFHEGLRVGFTKGKYYGADLNNDGSVTFDELGDFITKYSVPWVGDPVYYKDASDDTFYPSDPIPFTADMWNPGFYKTADYSGPQLTQVTDNSNAFDVAPQVLDNGRIIWQGWDGHDYEIYCQILGQGLTQLTDNDSPDAMPQMNAQGQAVWMNWDGSNWQVWYNLGDGPLQLTNSTGFNVLPQITADAQIYWQGWDGHDYEIYRYNHATQAITQLTDNEVPDAALQVNASGQLTWMALDSGGNWQVCYDTGNGPEQLTSSGANQSPQITDDGQIFYQGRDGGDYEIYRYTIGSAVTDQLTDNTGDDITPAVRNGVLVWSQYDGQDYEIYRRFLDTGITTQLTKDEDNDERPRLNSSGQIVWQKWDGSDYEVYVYK